MRSLDHNGIGNDCQLNPGPNLGVGILTWTVGIFGSLAVALIATALPHAPPPPEVVAPVSVLWGAEDRIAPLPGARLLGVEPEVIAGAGHWLHAEKPAIFLRLAREFLAATS